MSKEVFFIKNLLEHLKNAIWKKRSRGEGLPCVGCVRVHQPTPNTNTKRKNKIKKTRSIIAHQTQQPHEQPQHQESRGREEKKKKRFIVEK